MHHTNSCSLQLPHCLISTAPEYEFLFETNPYVCYLSLVCPLHQFQVVDVPVDPTFHRQLCQGFEGHHQLLLPLEDKDK